MKINREYIELDINDFTKNENEIFEQLVGENFQDLLIVKGIYFIIHYDFSKKETKYAKNS